MIAKRLLNMVRSLTACTLGIVLIAGCEIPPARTANVSASTAQDLVGTWRVVSATFFEQGKEEGQLFYGANPRGRLTFDENGNYALIVLDADMLKEPFKINDRERGTDDENRRVVHGSIANFGTYKVVDGTLVLSIEHATFPNWNGLVQKRRLLPSAEGSLKYEVKPASSGGGTAIFVWEQID